MLIYDKGDDDEHQRSGGALTMEGGEREGREVIRERSEAICFRWTGLDWIGLGWAGLVRLG